MFGVSLPPFPSSILLTIVKGWTSKDGREFGVVCQTDGAAFIEVLKDGSMVYLGRINTASSSALWRDAKIIGDMAYIVADVSKHGMQVFDMKKLLEADPKNPKVYAKEDLVTHFTGFGKAHNIVANEKTNLVFNVGGDGKCNGKLWAFDVKDPANPKDLGCSAGGSYVHDAQCVNYDGPDSKYKGKEVCFDFNVNVLVTVDNSDPTKAVQIGSAKYKGSAYTHQGWVTKGMTHLLLGDEQDEGSNGGNTRTFIFDIKDLANPKHTGTYISKSKAIDHNLYIIDNLAYQSNYATGLRVLDVDSVDKDNTGGGFQEIAYFDVYPEDDNKNPSISYVGSWSNYPYFKSGYILVNSMERGIFSVKMHKSALAHRNGTNVE